MRLYATRTSPYARKVRLALLEKGLAHELEWVDLRAEDHAARAHNPLGKIPVLIRNNGQAIYDSAVILQYLELFHPEPPLLPAEPNGRLQELQQEALADGIMDSTIAWVAEHRRTPDCQDPLLLKKARDKVLTGLGFLQEAARGWSGAAQAPVLRLGQIATIAAIGYVDLRAPEFLLHAADLHRWYQGLRHRQHVADTAPSLQD